MDYNVNFKGRLAVDGVIQNKARWENIAKIFKEETKGINYEASVFEDLGHLEIYVDRLKNKNSNFDVIDTLATREAILTEKGTQDLLSKPDGIVAKILAKYLQFVQKSDESFKQANILIDKAYDKISNLFVKNGYSSECASEIADTMLQGNNINAKVLGELKVLPEYNAIKEIACFEDASLSHFNSL